MISNPDYPIVFSFHGHSSLVHSVSWSPDGARLASGSRDKTIKIWKMKYQESTLQEELMRSERAYNLKLNGLNLEPVRPESKNLNKNKTSPPAWPRTHPFHWLESAKNGDSDAMIQLGIIYDRDNRNDKALKWYQKAADAGNDYGKERLEFLKKWIEDRGN